MNKMWNKFIKTTLIIQMKYFQIISNRNTLSNWILFRFDKYQLLGTT